MKRTLSPGWLLFILTGLNLFNYLDRYVLSAVAIPLQKELGISDGQVGRIVTTFMLGYFLTSPLFGYLGDRSSRKWLIAGGIFVWSLGTVLTGFAGTFAMLLAFRVLVGVGEASYATISPSLISDSYSTERRNNALTIFYAAIPVGAALGNILGGQIAAASSWRHAFIWAGAPGLVLALVLLPFAEPKRGAQDAVQPDAHAAKPKFADVFGLLRLPNYLLVILGYTAYTFALGAFALWGPAFLTRVHRVPVEDAAKFFGGVLVVAGLLGTLLGGLIATAWQKRTPAGYALMLGLSVFVAVPVAALAFLLNERTPAMICLAAAMFFLFLATGPVNTLILETVPVNLRASAMALSIFTIHLFGDMWSPELVGRLSDLLRDKFAAGSATLTPEALKLASEAHGLKRAVLLLPVALAVAAVFWLLLAARMGRRVVRS
ncbi:MAG TPA: MFS transporter [Candidatus Limnocylindria bacterium]|nr:MFS transporter [Candidatus Limnocylindria bacterium]